MVDNMGEKITVEHTLHNKVKCVVILDDVQKRYNIGMTGDTHVKFRFDPEPGTLLREKVTLTDALDGKIFGSHNIDGHYDGSLSTDTTNLNDSKESIRNIRANTQIINHWKRQRL